MFLIAIAFTSVILTLFRSVAAYAFSRLKTPAAGRLAASRRRRRRVQLFGMAQLFRAVYPQQPGPPLESLHPAAYSFCDLFDVVELFQCGDTEHVTIILFEVSFEFFAEAK